MSTPEPESHIIIIGAGIGGLTLAQGLRRRGVSFTVYEQDAQLDSMLQGYPLIIPDHMVSRFHDTITEDAWTNFEATCVTRPKGEVSLNAITAQTTARRCIRPPSNGMVSRVAVREPLRRALMTGIESSVEFGKKMVSYAIGDDGKSVHVTFRDDNEPVKGNLLVGADGFDSAVREQLLPTYKFKETGVYCVYGKNPCPEELSESLPKDYERWIMVVRDPAPMTQVTRDVRNGDSSVIMSCQPCFFEKRKENPNLPNNYTHWSIVFKTECLDQEPDPTRKRNANDISTSLAKEWDKSICSLMGLGSGKFPAYYGTAILSNSDGAPEWDTSNRVTLLGDAVHGMSPFSGEGAICALNDAIELSEAIYKDRTISLKSIRQYEKLMRAYANIRIDRGNKDDKQMFAEIRG
ncbi:hypothetical protein F4805DRAFT_408974 [Annulohypoxylon moriforme]|nr:hypothetical protein F4805DRAFT_408974 [Annulohypoxylon moriforme]